MNLSKDLSAFIGLLHSTGVKYLIGGGHAVAFSIPVHFIGKADLIRNKRATGRAQDLADLEKVDETFDRDTSR